MIEEKMGPDSLFEVSWEVCNKQGGIHTVVATKARTLSEEYPGRYIVIGPDVWRTTDGNPEFVEDMNLFRAWKAVASEEGLRVRIGRWSVPGNPIAFLVDFTPLISKKDELLAHYWTCFGVDSISGKWDYIDSLLFGHAAGMVIESFTRYNLNPHEKIVAQFHEWMSGAGVLYLKEKGLSIATVFTTHSTVLGRSLAGNGAHLYESMNLYNPDDKARELNVTAKHSLEKCSARSADVFTTVSDITAKECAAFLGRPVDIVTPNGFDNDIVPDGRTHATKREEARKRLVEVASLMSGKSYGADPMLIAISGRYEYRNKGIDIFIDAIEKLLSENYNGRDIIAFMMIPAAIDGPDRDLIVKRNTPGSQYKTMISHTLKNPDYDAIVHRLKELGITNERSQKVTTLFIPSYLNGNDGIFDMTYYDLLIGFDLTLFPSYYEPWGYTPLESLAFGVPSLTTSLAGFGQWIRDHYSKDHPSIEIIERDDSNYKDVVDAVAGSINKMSGLPPQVMEEYRESSKEVSFTALWRNNIEFYRNAYEQALKKVVERNGAFPEYQDRSKMSKYKINQPVWSRILVSRKLPERLSHLDTLSKNMWWCWNQDAISLFKSIDKDLWDSSKWNPIAMLDKISYKKYKDLEQDEDFIKRMDEVYNHFEAYLEARRVKQGPSIAYFSMEYGLDSSLKIYSGGLGILAGDYMKESSDIGVDFTAVGLLYKYGYFRQQLSSMGDQVAEYDPQDFMKTAALPVRDKEDKWITISISLPGRNLYARLWRVNVGCNDLILLDTDFEDNLPEDRPITHNLYGGDWENRLKQEILLGIGGVRALRALGLNPELYHCNEGHAAMIGVERLNEYINTHNLSYAEALEVVRASSLFTTHTPVPAGHDAFTEDMLRTYFSHYPERLKIDWHTFMGLGKVNPDDEGEKFSMSNLAANLSQEVNGVSWLHGKVSQEILADLWPGYLPEESHIGYVTNGVHYDTWTAAPWKLVHAKLFGEDFASHRYNKDVFKKIYDLSDEQVWNIRKTLKKRLSHVVKRRLTDSGSTNHYSPKQIVEIADNFRDDVLTIGFARRFATYKRAHLLFTDLQRLDDIINNPDRPVQFLFAGKAHPNDKAGQDLIKHIVGISKLPQFIGKIVFLPNYDMNLARVMVQGVDVWLNTPTRPQEASGTSGEKAVMNGVMHFSVLDGWWVEGYKEGAGWALPMERTYDDQAFQNELDAATIYNILENEIIPEYYHKDMESGISAGWVDTIKKNIAEVASNFTTNRMFNDYINKYYNPLSTRSQLLRKDDYAQAREIAEWKGMMRKEWPHIEVVSFIKPDDAVEAMMTGEEYISEIKLSIGTLDPGNLGVEILFVEQDSKGKLKIRSIYPFDFISVDKGVALYRCKITPDTTGVFQISGRVFAKNSKLPHRQDFELVKWL